MRNIAAAAVKDCCRMTIDIEVIPVSPQTRAHCVMTRHSAGICIPSCSTIETGFAVKFAACQFQHVFTQRSLHFSAQHI